MPFDNVGGARSAGPFDFLWRKPMLRIRSVRALGALAGVLLGAPGNAFAHGGHTPQPPGIIDPLITHHAVLEDELKLNYFGSRLGEENLTAHTGTLEIAYAITDLIGFELFVPFGMTIVESETRGGLGDLDILFPKISFVRERGVVMTTDVAVRAPTGDESAGLGEPGWTFAPHLLTDLGLGNFGLQVNVATEFETDGAIALEGNHSLAHSFVLDEDARVVMSPLVETNVEAPVRGEEAGEVVGALTPGLKLGIGGWHIGLGVQLPVTEHREFDYRGLVQVGYHVTWEDVFGGWNEESRD